jgi:hypothetical protein
MLQIMEFSNAVGKAFLETWFMLFHILPLAQAQFLSEDRRIFIVSLWSAVRLFGPRSLKYHIFIYETKKDFHGLIHQVTLTKLF